MGKTLYHQGDISYFEAVNKETLKNAFQRFQEEGIITIRKSKSGRTPPLMRVSPDWIANGRLWEFVEKIAISRREGKNRRDNESVSFRVLKLAERCGRELFERGGVRDGVEDVEGGTGVEGLEIEVSKPRRRGGRSGSRGAKL